MPAGARPSSDQQQQTPNNQQQAPQDGNRQFMRGRGFKGGHRGRMGLDALVQNGVISQETRDAIDTYLSEKKNNRENTLFKELLDAGVITQEEYDAIIAAQADAAPEAEDAPEADEPDVQEAPYNDEAPEDDEAPEAPGMPLAPAIDDTL